MVISDLQLSLIGAGVLGVVAVWGYNAWQERRYRKAAEQVFRRVEPDPLLPEEPIQYGTDLTADAIVDDERLEPSLGRLHDDTGVEIEAPGASEPNNGSPAVAPPELLVDPMIEMVARLHLHQPVTGAILSDLQRELSVLVSKPVHIAARGDAEWLAVDASNAGAGFGEACVTAQLADRRGPLNATEVDALVGGLEAFAARNHVSLDRFVAVSVLTQAQALDTFCASVDLQIALHVVPSAAEGFSGTKVRGLIEALGFQAGAGRAYHLSDEAGGSLFALSNADSTPLTPDQMKNLTLPGISFWLDVPLVAQGGAVFDRMVASARQLAQALDGKLVDDQRGVLIDSALATIRKKIVEIQDEMAAADIPAGGRRALRLFA